MPEGDAIFRTARTLHRALAGREVVRFESAFPRLTRVDDDTPLAGRRVESVTAAGKHLLMRFSGDLTLRTHMRMNGSWHIYRPGERWLRPRRDMRILIETADYAAVGFNVPVAEFLDARAEARHGELRAMGPDLLGNGFDIEDAMRRIREHDGEQIADILLNQRVVAGLGNIYKSEVLFICRVNPFARAADVTDAAIRTLLQTGRTLLQANVNALGGITTYLGYGRRREGDASQRRYVYGRARKPCRRCGTAIRVRPQGAHARLTYWCPRCQL